MAKKERRRIFLDFLLEFDLVVRYYTEQTLNKGGLVTSVEFSGGGLGRLLRGLSWRRLSASFARFKSPSNIAG
jgi:hypothetical protein